MAKRTKSGAVTVTVSGAEVDALLWPTGSKASQASAQAGAYLHALIDDRAFDKGQGVDGTQHKPYSERGPVYVYPGKGTGARLSPKGGEETPGGGQRFDSYGDYKRKSRKGGISGPEVDLTLSGQMRREFGVKQVRADGGVIGLRGAAEEYGSYVDAQRPWAGVTDKEADKFAEACVRIAERVNGGKR